MPADDPRPSNDGLLTALRAIGYAEGSSFLLLLGVAMPLKYLAGQPLMVRYVGWAHGVLFVLYVGAVLGVALAHEWRIGRVLKAMVAAVVPFGPFVLEREWRREQEAERSEG